MGFPRCLALTGVFVFGATSPALAQSAIQTHTSASSLRLEEEWSVALPPEYDMRGAALSRQGTVVVWSFSRPELLIIASDGGLRTLAYAANDAPSGVGFLPADSGVIVMSGRDGRVLRVSFSGVILGEEFLPIPDSAMLLDAVCANQRWVLALRRPNGDVYLAATSESSLVDIKRFSRAWSLDFLPDSLAQVRVGLASWADAVVATYLWYPFTVFLLDKSNRVVDSLVPDLDVDLTGGRSTSPRYTLSSLPAFPLDSGYVQMISDLASDERLLIRYDNSGEEVNKVRLNAPIGFVAASPARHELIAARRAAGLELVKYHWHWVRESRASQEDKQ
jgi:hypothetical protein